MVVHERDGAVELSVTALHRSVLSPTPLSPEAARGLVMEIEKVKDVSETVNLLSARV